MPIPKPIKNEDKNKFISRCMGDPIMNKEYPGQSQRAAICYSSLKQAKKKQRAKGSKQEPTWEEYSKDYLGDGYVLF